MFYRPILLALTFIVLPVVCHAELITAYDLTGKAGNEFFDSATAMAPHVNGEALLRGDGLTATAATNSFAASGWDDNSPRDYFTFSFFVAPGYQVTLTDLLIATRSSSTGPGSLWLYYNYTGTLDIVRETFTQSGTVTLNSDVDLANLTVTGRATFTIYRDPFVGSASGGVVSPSGTFRIANYTDPDTSVISPITLLGTVSRISPYGDFNYDGVVDARDYNVWRSSFGSVLQLAADGNENSVVDAADYVMWRKNLGSQGPPPTGMSAAVPEPSTLLLAALGGIAVIVIPRQIAMHHPGVCHCCRLSKKLRVIRCPKTLFAFWLAIVGGTVLLHSSTAQAAKFWKNSVGSGNWSTGNNWSASSAAGTDNGDVPTTGEPVRIVFTDGTPRTVTYDVNAPIIGLLSVDLMGAGISAATFAVPNDNNLTAAAIFVGGYSGTAATNGRGALTQSAGALATNPGTDLVVGHGANSMGTYTMTGGTFTAAQNEFVGYSGTGVFNQSGGTNTLPSSSAFFEVGDNVGATGTYNLSGTGTLTSNSSEYVGYFGGGNFNQTGGTNNAFRALMLGAMAGSTGSYSISGGTLNVAGDLAVGGAGMGTMTIGTSGSVYVLNNLSINSASSINLNGGLLRFSSATGLDRLTFNSGTVQLRSFDNTIVTSLFGATPVIPAGKALVLEGDVSLVAVDVTVQGGQLTTNNSLQTANGLIQVADGGTLNAGDTFDSTYVSFSGAGTSANLGDFYVASYGRMTIANGAVVKSATSSVGDASGAHSAATVTGAGSIWHTSDLNVSGLGSGTLTVQNGGLVDAADVVVGTQGAIILDGGTLRCRSIGGASARITFNYGTVELTGNRTVNADFITTSLFGAFPTISAREGFTVDGTATLTTSLTVDGGTFTAGGLAGAANLHLLHGTLNVTNQALTVGPTGNLASGLDLASDVTINSTLGITNQGLVTGDGQIGGRFTNATTGEVRVASGKSLTLTGAGNTNAGHINLYGGQLEYTQNLTNTSGGFVSGNGTLITAGLTNQGTMNFSGLANIAGDVTNVVGGKIISTGGGPTTFFDDVANQGEIYTSPGGFSVFFGSVSGAGTFTGAGTVNVEGELDPGNSPATVQFDGNVAFGSAASLKIELAGSTPGVQYDQVHVIGQLSLNGKLDLSLLGTYMPAVGTTFDILDWGSLAGAFFSLQLPTLTTGIWDTSQLYTTGTLSVVGGLAGDYNHNGIVDAADYLVWRKGLGTTYTQNDYNVWRANFGRTAGAGSGAIATAVVPEPTTLVLLMFAMAGWCLRRSRAE